MTDDKDTKINTQRDQIDDKNSEIQHLHDRMELLDQNDIKNAVEHKELFDQNKQLADTMRNIDCKLEPIADTYRTVGILAKWFVALLVFLSVLGGVLLTWGKIFKKE